MKVIASGQTIDLGTLETTPTIGITDYSKRTTDDFGVTTVVPRGFSRTMSVKLGVPFDNVDAIQRQLANLRATSASWIADDRFQWLRADGFYKDFSLDLAVPPLSYCTLTVEGLAETETVADTGGDPAPDGQPSTLQLLQPVEITDSILTSINVAENDYPVWSSATTYGIGDRRIRSHRIYESLTGGNVGHDPVSDGATWLDVGPTNRWAMFDQALGTVTNAAGSLVLTLNRGSANAIALLDVTGSTVRVQTPVHNALPGYDRTITAGLGTILFLDLPADGEPATVTITGSGNVAVGTLLLGILLGLGTTEASPAAGINDYSKKTVDDFGGVTIVQRSYSKTMTAKALLRTDMLDLVANRIAAVRARPVLWIGQAALDSLTIYGFFKDFSIEVDQNVSKLSLSIEGLSKAAPITSGGLGGPTAWPDITDPLGTKPANNATDTRNPSTPIGPNGKTVGQLLADVMTALASSGDAEALQQFSDALVRIEAAARQGAPNLLLNGDFSDGLNHWAVSPGAFTPTFYATVGQYLRHGPGQGGAFPAVCYQDVPVVPGASYSISYEGIAYAGADAHVYGEWWTPGASSKIGIMVDRLPTGNWGTRLACDPVIAPTGTGILRVVIYCQDADVGFDTSRYMVQLGTATDWRDDASQASTTGRTTALEGDGAAYAESITNLTAQLAGTANSGLKQSIATVNTKAQAGVDAQTAVSQLSQSTDARFALTADSPLKQAVDAKASTSTVNAAFASRDQALGIYQQSVSAQLNGFSPSGLLSSINAKADATITSQAIADINGKLTSRIDLSAIAGTANAQVTVLALDGSEPYSVIYFKAGRFAFDGGDLIASTIRATKFVTDQGVDLAAIVPGQLGYDRTGSDGSNFYTLSGNGSATPIVASTAAGLIAQDTRVTPAVTFYIENDGGTSPPFGCTAQLMYLPVSGGSWTFLATLGQGSTTSSNTLTLAPVPFKPGNLGNVYLGVRIVANNNTPGAVANISLSASIDARKG